MGHDKNEIYEIKPDVVAMSSTIGAALSMQANSHSVGLMFEQSVSQQQNQFQLGLSSSVMNIKKISTIRMSKKGNKYLRESRFDI